MILGVLYEVFNIIRYPRERRKCVRMTATIRNFSN